MADALEAMGAPAEGVAAARARGSGEDFFYHDDTREAVLFFLDLWSQWNHVGTMAGVVRTGLNYPAVESAMRLSGIGGKSRAALFADLQLMESAALKVFLEEAERRRR